MKRSLTATSSKPPRGTEELARLANGLAESGSRAEDAAWEQALETAIRTLLQEDEESTLNAALDYLLSTEQPGYEVLADMLETCTEQFSSAGEEVLLLTIPLLAWSRFTIPAQTIPADILTQLRTLLHKHVLAEGVQLGLADMLYSPDQLPQGFCETARFATRMHEPARKNGVLAIKSSELPASERFLSDTRYLLAAICVKPAQPIFRWQEKAGNRQQALQNWRKQAGNCLAPLMAACAYELQLPDAFFAACRETDRASRAYSIQASTAFLSTTLEIAPDQLRAIVAPFYEQEIVEYRIGFTPLSSKNVLHGVVWPLLGPEDQPEEVPAQIEAALKANGIGRVEHLDNRFPVEFCDDCGAPMYPSPDGEIVHAEMPEEKLEQFPAHLH